MKDRDGFHFLGSNIQFRKWVLKQKLQFYSEYPFQNTKCNGILTMFIIVILVHILVYMDEHDSSWTLSSEIGVTSMCVSDINSKFLPYFNARLKIDIFSLSLLLKPFNTCMKFIYNHVRCSFYCLQCIFLLYCLLWKQQYHSIYSVPGLIFPHFMYNKFL